MQTLPKTLPPSQRLCFYWMYHEDTQCTWTPLLIKKNLFGLSIKHFTANLIHKATFFFFLLLLEIFFDSLWKNCEVWTILTVWFVICPATTLLYLWTQDCTKRCFTRFDDQCSSKCLKQWQHVLSVCHVRKLWCSLWIFCNYQTASVLSTKLQKHRMVDSICVFWAPAG